VVEDALSRRPSIYAMTDVLVDWKDLLVIEYSKNKFPFQVVDGQI
jgi:hypothetical protein